MLLGSLSGTLLGWLMGFLSLFLVLLILIQRGRGGGLTGALGGPGGQSAFGSKAGDTFTLITVVVATIWGFSCAFTMWLLGTHTPTVTLTKSSINAGPGDDALDPSNQTILPTGSGPSMDLPALDGLGAGLGEEPSNDLELVPANTDGSPESEPAAETPSAETSPAETSAADAPMTESPAAETPATETPAAAEPTTETPAAEADAAEEKVSE